ncbi:MAG: UDP-N-acetylmuramoyl-tripeptide--D-alanyl-D-alanine ligase [Sphaerochaetaceae bacterium]|nr:UDP-N-acetylmuramoyl-tripeptide--D-alanyl-D-alanine ligase [Sphaerochaetaceae bacterium]
MKLMDCMHMAAMAGGTVLGKQPFPPISSITIDSRKAGKGSLFVALSGEVSDGHDYVTEAFASGASAAMVSSRHAHRIKSRLSSEHHALIVVEDPLAALQQMAASHVASFPDVKRVGITGSCGKTTTKEMVASILGAAGKTARTPGNFNSEIGLPISVFEIDGETEYGVFEMGVDHVGEMDRMLDIWRPQVAVITNIGLSHVGKMGSMQVIAKEKSKLFHQDIESAFIAENSAWTSYIRKLRSVDVHTFGRLGTEGVSSIESLGIHGWKLVYRGADIHLRAVGTHNLMDALAAISVSQSFGLEPELVREGLEGFASVPGRSRITDGSVTVIEDWYNASVDSTTTILDYMGTLPWSGRKLAVLGSMKELGAATDSAHRQVARKLLSCDLDEIYLYGKEMESAFSELKKLGFDRNVFFTDDYDALQDRMAAQTRKGDLVLLKGSRAMAMERLVPALTSIA